MNVLLLEYIELFIIVALFIDLFTARIFPGIKAAVLSQREYFLNQSNYLKELRARPALYAREMQIKREQHDKLQSKIEKWRLQLKKQQEYEQNKLAAWTGESLKKRKQGYEYFVAHEQEKEARAALVKELYSEILPTYFTPAVNEEYVQKMVSKSLPVSIKERL